MRFDGRASQATSNCTLKRHHLVFASANSNVRSMINRINGNPSSSYSTFKRRVVPNISFFCIFGHNHLACGLFGIAVYRTKR